MARPKKKKVEVVFDPQKRKEFLTGFRKRKNERRSRAKAELDRNLKEEHKRIRQEVKDGFKHLKKSFEPLRELTAEDKAEGTEKAAYEDDEVQVKIVELSTNDLAAQRNMLGANIADDSEEEEAQADSDDDDKLQTNRIPGMDFDVNATRKRKAADKDEEEPSEKAAKGSAHDADIKSKKELDKLMKTKTLKKIKKSKLFKMKERMDNKNNQKKAKRDRNNTIKSVPKHQRKKLKHGLKTPGGQTRYRKGRMMNKKELRRKRGGGGE
ncbi:nucleolar protein 12 [Drosophila sulfurigaster albostrigata]|uniref:nucleolar protein 12 n=1 Tax=Drosophila sulfurigaster albostrigata TaxID=89887 RepID=UPI002D21ADA4|nr:nucleolar protein 12 [Drosophila sulfurigaster albostrigata]